MKKILSLAEINPTQLTEYQNNHLSELVKISETFNQFYPCSVFLSFSEYDNAEHYEYSFIGATYKNLNFSISYSEHKKRYTIYCENLKDFNNVTHYTRQAIEKKLVEPKNIGVLSLKKIIEWFEYYVSIYNELKIQDQANANEKNAFLDSIKDLPVEWYNNGKGGEITKNGITYEFTIEETYIRQSIKLNYKVPTTLESFFKLSDNKY